MGKKAEPDKIIIANEEKAKREASVFRLQSSVFRLPSSVFRLPTDQIPEMLTGN
jgi:hypothetical protein